MIQRPPQCDSIFNFFLFLGLLNPLLFFSCFFVSFTLLCFFVLWSVSFSYVFFPALWLPIRNTLLNSPALLLSSRFWSAPDFWKTSIFLLISTAASSSFSYSLRDFFLSELGLCGCQGTHLLPQSYSIVIACRLPNTAFVLSNALQKLFCIAILLSLVSLQFFFCKFDSLCLFLLALVFGTCPSMLSYVIIFCTLFFLLPLCNCIVPLLLNNCNSFI